MVGAYCGAVLAAALVACGDDGGTGNGALDASVDGASDANTAAVLVVSGTACTTPVSYAPAGDEKLRLYLSSGGLDTITIMDGPSFDKDSDAMWQAYAASHDCAFVIGIDGPPAPLTPHTITSLFDGVLGARGTGTMGFVERGMGESLTINAIDTTAKTIDLDLVLPVSAYTSTYPPDFSMLNPCMSGTVNISFTGPYE
jgi:hypothetical protein